MYSVDQNKSYFFKYLKGGEIDFMDGWETLQGIMAVYLFILQSTKSYEVKQFA